MREWAKVLAGSLALMIGASGPSLFAEWYRQRYDVQTTALDQPRNQGNLQNPKAEEPGAKPGSSTLKEVPSHPAAKIEKGEEEKAKQDRRLADYTEFLFFATLFLGVATAGLVVVAYSQMRESRQSIDATVQLAKAAVEHANHADRAIRVSEDAAKRQLRAYVLVGQATILDPDGPNPRLHIRFINSGQTPAYDVIALATVGAFNPQDPRIFPLPAIDRQSSKSFLGAGSIASKIVSLTGILNGNAMLLLRAGTEHILYAWGEIQYMDIFKEEIRHSRFRLSIGGSLGWPETNLMVVSPEGNEAD
jgi:hypothetical protein